MAPVRRPPTGPADECAALHLGGRAARWGNLGCWHPGLPGANASYADAAEALALAVAQAAGVQDGERVLALGCGEGEELALVRRLWPHAQCWGVEADPARWRRGCSGPAAPDHAAGRWLLGSAVQPPPALVPGTFDRLLVVDAAYHFVPREAFLAAAARLLRPGGTLAYTDLAPARTPASRARHGAVLALAARLCGLSGGRLLPLADQVARLQSQGFGAVQVQDLSEPVLGGFAAFVQRHAAAHGLSLLQPAWRRTALTARLIGPCRRAGLGYVLLSAVRQPAGAADAPSPGAGSSADATA